MGEVRRDPRQTLGQGGSRGVRLDDGVVDPEGVEHAHEHGGGRGLRDRDPDPAAVDLPQVDAALPGPAHHRPRVGDDRSDGVEQRGVVDLDAGRAQLLAQRVGLAAHPLGDAAQAGGPVVDGVHRRGDREQHLGGADVAGRLVATDVLLPGLQGEPVGRAALGVLADPDEPPREVPLQTRAHRHESGVRAAVEQRHAEALGRADHDVGAHLAGRLEQGQGEQVGRHDRGGTPLVGGIDHRSGVTHGAVGAGVLDEHGVHRLLPQPRPGVAHVDLDAQRLGPGADHLDGLRQHALVDDEPARGLAVRALAQRHRLGGRGALVEQRRVGRGQTGQVPDHGLEVQQRLEPALRDLRLVRRVGGVPARVLEHVAPDHRRGDRAVVALPDHRLERAVLGRQVTQLPCRLPLGRGRGQRQLGGLGDAARNGGPHQRGQ